MARAHTRSFKSEVNIPTEAILSVYGRSPMGEALTTGMKGAVEGISMGETIRKLRNKRVAAKLLAEQPDLIGMEQGMPQEFLEAAIEDPQLLTAISRRRRQEPRTPFRIGADGRIQVADPAQSLSAPEAQALLRQQQMERVRQNAETQYNYARERLALSKTNSERKFWMDTIKASGDLMLKAGNREAWEGLQEMVPEAIAGLRGIDGEDDNDGTVAVIDSSGKEWQIPNEKLAEALRRDPKLKVKVH